MNDHPTEEPQEKPKRSEDRRMDMQTLGQFLLVGGIVIALLGGVMMLLGRLPFLSRFGNLPGDIHIEGQGFSCLIPIVSMLLLSVLFTIILNIIIRLINRP
jgi:hypothetical protein